MIPQHGSIFPPRTSSFPEFVQDGVVTRLNNLMPANSAFEFMGTPTAINNAGQIIGTGRLFTHPRSVFPGFVSDAYLFDFHRGTINDLGVLGIPADNDGGPPAIGFTTPLSINNLGQVVGSSTTAHTDNAFIWKNGTMTDLGVGTAFAINNVGQVIGLFGPDFAHITLKLWKDGIAADLLARLA